MSDHRDIMRPPLFIGGPYTGDGSKETRERNIERASTLATFFRRRKFTPYCPHPMSERGIFDEVDPQALHDEAMNSTLSMLMIFHRVTQRTKTTAVFILNDDHSAHGGTAEEIDMCKYFQIQYVAKTWSEWEAFMEEHKGATDWRSMIICQ